MKTSYAAFIEANPNCSKYESDPVAQSIFEMLSQDEAIIAMAAAADQNKPALGPCVQMVENYAATLTTPSFDIENDFERTVVGRMVKAILEPFGYRVTTQKDLPKQWKGRYFSSASCYALSAPDEAVMRIVKKVEAV